MPRRPQTPEEFAKVRQRLIETARAIHAEEGAEAVTLRNVARRAGFSPAAIYRYFQDADELSASVFEDDASRLAERMRAACDQNPSHRGRLAGMLRAYADFALEDMAAFRAGFLRLLRRPAAERAARGALAATPFALLLAEVASAMADGAIAPGDTGLIAQTLWGVMNGVVGLDQTGADVPSADRNARIEYAITMALRGIAGDG